MTAWLWLGTVAATLATPMAAAAAPVTTSPRPEMRPDLRIILPERPDAARLDAPRPVARGDDIQTAQTLVVASGTEGFDAWRAGFRARARADGIEDAVFNRAFQGARYDASIIQLDRRQSEFTKQIWDYLDSAVSAQRVANGRAAMRRHAQTLANIEARYGVDRHVVAAIWGLESAYGANRGNSPLIGSLATLAYDGRRGAFFEDQLIAALKIVQAGDVDPRRMTGSWAGAMGHTQFMPTSYLSHAVDFTGDGRRDIWSDDPSDALASTAAYLAHFGWKKGQPWGVEVRLPPGFDPARARRDLTRSPRAWATEGVRDMAGRPVPDYGRASILLPASSAGAAFMIFDNFKVIEHYNKADAYVIGVGHLADRLRGGPAIQGGWPRHYHPISFAQKKEIQTRLRSRGFGVEKIDGIIGPNTIDAIRAFQQSAGLMADGYASRELLRALGG